MSFDTHWRNTMKPTRFLFGTDARAALLLLLLMVHLRLWTFLLVTAIMILFYVLEQRGLSFEAAIRAFRVWITGPRRTRILLRHKSRWTDYG